jgi:hypothetical protein
LISFFDHFHSLAIATACMASTFFKTASGEFLSGWQPDTTNSRLNQKIRLRDMQRFFTLHEFRMSADFIILQYYA